MSQDALDFFPSSDPPPEEKINFHFEQIKFHLDKPKSISNWIVQIIEQYSYELVELNFIFCTDAYLHKINLEYLDHDTFTDVITFPYRKAPEVEGDIYISLERVKENAGNLNLAIEEELHRVMIHAVLHLCGFSDKSPEEKKIMTEKEDEALKILAVSP